MPCFIDTEKQCYVTQILTMPYPLKYLSFIEMFSMLCCWYYLLSRFLRICHRPYPQRLSRHNFKWRKCSCNGNWLSPSNRKFSNGVSSGGYKHRPQESKNDNTLCPQCFTIIYFNTDSAIQYLLHISALKHAVMHIYMRELFPFRYPGQIPLHEHFFYILFY